MARAGRCGGGGGGAAVAAPLPTGATAPPRWAAAVAARPHRRATPPPRGRHLPRSDGGAPPRSARGERMVADGRSWCGARPSRSPRRSSSPAPALTALCSTAADDPRAPPHGARLPPDCGGGADRGVSLPPPPPTDAGAPTCVSGQTSTPRRGPRRPRPAVRCRTPPACGAKHGGGAGSSPHPPALNTRAPPGAGAGPRPDAAVCSPTASPTPPQSVVYRRPCSSFSAPPTASHASMVGGGGGSTAWALAWVRGVTRRRRCCSRFYGRCPRERAKAAAPPVCCAFLSPSAVSWPRQPPWPAPSGGGGCGPRRVAAVVVARADLRRWRWEQRKKEGRAHRRAAAATQSGGWDL